MSLGILSIATNRYVEYWCEMAESFAQIVSKPENHTFYVFTDESSRVEAFQKDHPKVNVVIFPIQSMKFPEASLLRYRIYTQYSDLFMNEVLVHLDADMLIRSESFLNIEKMLRSSASGVALVAHPGYWRPSGHQLRKLYLRQPDMLLRDALRFTRVGGLGAWETNRKSTCYTPRKKRRMYVCGGIWGARKLEFRKICETLSERTKIELESGIMPIWHDESILNYWASQNIFSLLPPSFCFEPRYPQLRTLDNIVEAVNKSER